MRTDAAVKWAVEAFKDDRNERYDKLQRYIDGDHDLEYATEKFSSAFGPLFRAFSYNRCGMVVDAHADRLLVESLSSDDMPDLGELANKEWHANSMRAREGHAEVDSFGLGDAYVIAEVDPNASPTRVHYWIQDPREVRVKYSSRVPGELEIGAKAWRDDDGYVRLNVYHPDRVERYITRDKTESLPSNADMLERYDRPEDGEPWTFRLNVTDTVPIFHIPNNGRTGEYGRSELEPVIPLQDALNKTLMDMLVAMEFAAYPQRYIIGAEPENEKQRKQFEAFQVGLDRILTIFAPDAKAGEFGVANVTQFLAVAEFWDAAISRVTKVPVHYLGMSGEFSSGVARRLAEAPFTAKIEDRQASNGQVWHDVARYTVRSHGYDVEPGIIQVNWRPAAPIAEEERLERAAQMDMLNIPLEIWALDALGWDQDKVAKALAAKKRAVAEATRAFDAGMIAPSLEDDADDSDEAA